MPIELGASWFSSKCVEAQRLWILLTIDEVESRLGLSRGKALFRCGLRKRYQIVAN